MSDSGRESPPGWGVTELNESLQATLWRDAKLHQPCSNHLNDGGLIFRVGVHQPLFYVVADCPERIRLAVLAKHMADLV